MVVQKVFFVSPVAIQDDERLFRENQRFSDLQKFTNRVVEDTFESNSSEHPTQRRAKLTQ
jgi:hypothetical protein